VGDDPAGVAVPAACARGRIVGPTGFERLYLAKTKIAGPGLKHLAGLRKLFLLVLSGTLVDDGAVDNLLALKTVRELNLTGTKVSAVGLRQLKAGLPYCKIMPEPK